MNFASRLAAVVLAAALMGWSLPASAQSAPPPQNLPPPQRTPGPDYYGPDELVSSGHPPFPFEAIRDGCGTPAIFARPPHDLPALLRLADQLESQAAEHQGERAMVWKCECGTRYAFPVALFRAVTIRCDQCGRPVELSFGRSTGEDSLLDPGEDAANRCRKELARFFRDAMARGWPVVVSSSD